MNSTSALMFISALLKAEINKIISHLRTTHNLHSKQNDYSKSTHLTNTMYKDTTQATNVKITMQQISDIHI